MIKKLSLYTNFFCRMDFPGGKDAKTVTSDEKVATDAAIQSHGDATETGK